MLVERMGEKVVVLKNKKIWMKINEKLINRFMKYVKKTENCWEWIGVKNLQGYGRFCICYKGIYAQINAHRISYMIFKDSISKEMTVHHLCRNKSCVNPEHLELMTEKENRELSGCWSAKNRRKTHCIYGHPFNNENTYYYILKNKTRSRSCRICRRRNKKIYKLKLKNKDKT